MTLSQQRDKTCFFIAPIGDEGSAIRERSDDLLECVVQPAAVACGYGRVIRADGIPTPGIITNDIIQHLIQDDLVVADLSGHNANVFYELAIRHAAGKPCVQMIQKGEPIPFDLSQVRTLRINYPSLRAIERFRADLEKQIRQAEKRPSAGDNPLSQAIELMSMKKSSNRSIRATAELRSEMANLRAELRSLSADLADAPNSRLVADASKEALAELNRQLR